jgi:protein O-GlcNAc transferase
LLNAMQLPELVGADQEDMVRIATRVGTDAGYRTRLRETISANRSSAPLFDTARYTRDFETGIELMVQRQRAGLAPARIDVPDAGPVVPGAAAPTFLGRVAVLQSAYPGCPLCDGASVALGLANCGAHALWHEPLPTSIEWLRCSSCAHVHTRHHWTELGQMELLRNHSQNLPANPPAVLEARRAVWTLLVERAVKLLGGYQALMNDPARPVWVDVGAGDGSLVMAASDYGFVTIGLDIAVEAVTRIQRLGFNAKQHDFMTLPFEITPRVLSLMDVLQQLPDPREALRKAAQILPPGGVLIISTPDMQSSGWKLLDAANANPFWTEIRHHHIFTRERLLAVLRECAFEVVDLTVPGRHQAHTELYALRTSQECKAP